jgi:hypothetical protein
MLIPGLLTYIQSVAIAPLIINAFDGPNELQDACNHD